jgi:hypothetical protein
MKKMIEVSCCDGCGKQFGKDAEMQPYSTELYTGGTATHTECKVTVTLTVDGKPAELCVHCLTGLCYNLERNPFFEKDAI